MSLTYRYNDVSNITRLLDNLGVNDQDFQYDELNRLTFASGTYGDIDYTYDGVGNRLSRTVEDNGATTNETYQYEPGSHRIDRVITTGDTGTDTRQFAHDNNGNIVSDVSSERDLEMNVSARNRLAVVRKDGERVGEYEYNALGQRVAKTSRYRGRLHSHFDQGNKTKFSGAPERANVISTGGRAATEVEKSQAKSNQSGTNLHSHYDNKPVTERLHFHYDQQGNLIAESDNEGNIVREYIYLGNYRIAMTARSLDKPGMSPSVIPTGTPAGRGAEGSLALYFIHNDHLGTPQKVTDAQQRIVWSMEQTPFGEVAIATEAIRMPMRLPGQYADIESGFSYNYFRDYDPSLGRYMQSDPIGLLGGPNTFGYVISNPIRFNDPTGLVAPAVAVGIGAFVGGTAQAATTAFQGGSFGAVASSFLGGALAGATITASALTGGVGGLVFGIGVGAGVDAIVVGTLLDENSQDCQ